MGWSHIKYLGTKEAIVMELKRKNIQNYFCRIIEYIFMAYHNWIRIEKETANAAWCSYLIDLIPI